MAEKAAGTAKAPQQMPRHVMPGLHGKKWLRPGPVAAKLALTNGTAEERRSCPAPAVPRLDAEEEMHRISAAGTSAAILNISCGETDEDTINQAWKRLVILLHPDKLCNLDGEAQEAGVWCLDLVNNARADMRQLSQQVFAGVPVRPAPDGNAKLLCSTSGERKYEMKWKLPDAQDPARPVQGYEVWGPKYFCDAGEPYEWVLLASLPALQAHFVLAEEAPTQQDVMWAGDRIRRATLPLQVHAVNGAGSSEALSFEMPWLSAFPWLNGTKTVLCSQCMQLTPCRSGWTRCQGCNLQVAKENQTITVRCPACQGEVMWSHKGSQFACTCCLKQFGGATAKNNSRMTSSDDSKPHGRGGANRRGGR